ncbi:prepilin peptidase [Methanobrevibacter sp.]|uniref:prepilin peptidase n=1 Tax=Methanobrevibacter sp. TaxID=66852 RepID=UPI0038688454
MNFSVIFLLQIIVTILFCILATIFDVKKGIVPDLLTGNLLIFGFISNVLLAIFSSNIKYILASIISVVITYTITYLMWQLNIWGGGDVKLFTGIASVIPFGFNLEYLNIFPELSIYPFSFSVVINSVLVSFPFLVIFVIHLVVKNKVFRRNSDLLLNIFNFESLKYLVDSTLNKWISVKDIEDGAIVNEYYFNNEYICELINEIDGNLKVYKSDDEYFRYYFKSQSAGGITKEEMYLLKVMSAQGFISDQLSVKIAFPFTPAILLGLMIAIGYGDIMMIFTKNVILVI